MQLPTGLKNMALQEKWKCINREDILILLFSAALHFAPSPYESVLHNQESGILPIHVCLCVLPIMQLNRNHHLIRIENYHIWSTFVFRSAGLSSESPQVSYVKVNLEKRGTILLNQLDLLSSTSSPIVWNQGRFFWGFNFRECRGTRRKTSE